FAIPCTASVSSIWFPIVSTGFSAVIGSWNTSAMPAPRTFCISRSPSVSRSRPLNTIRPPAIRPGGCTRRRIDSAVTDFPLPYSPTRQSVSPASTWKLTSETAAAGPAGRSNTVVRCSTLSSAASDARYSISDARYSISDNRSDIGSRVSDIGSRLSDIGLSVFTEHAAHGVRDFADGRVRLDGTDDRRHEIVAPARGGGDGLERGAPGRCVARRADLTHARDPPPLQFRIDAQRVDPSSFLGSVGETTLRLVRVSVHADHDALARVDPLLRGVGGVLDLALDEPRLDRRERAAQRVDAID